MQNGNNLHKILIVEDNVAAQILVKEILEVLEVTIVVTGLAEEAIDLFKVYNTEIALVIIDLKLPNWDGGELLKQLRRINTNIPAIAVSASRPTELAAKAKAAGFNGWMEKPFDLDEFVEMVSTYL